ncbi:MAG: hypothetical protein IJ193_07200 [Bacilli bacterium]|nr:hypothetical protein [Bacilli bacterium]
MKKTIRYSILFLIGGILVGIHIYKNMSPELLRTFQEKERYYCLQYGVYQNKETMQKEIRDISPKLVLEENGIYTVYLAITGNKENAEKMKNYFEKDGISSYLKEIKIDNIDFQNNVREFDLLIENMDKKEEVMRIEEVVLSNYENKLEKE